MQNLNFGKLGAALNQDTVRQNAGSTGIDVSIVVPVYNSEEFIEETIRSIFSSNWVRVEAIAVVDGSPDNSIGVLKRLQTEFPNLRVMQHDNVGGATTLNRGLRAAKGRFVGFLDGDDCLLPGALDTLFARCENDKSDMASGLVLRWKKTRVWRTYDQSMTIGMDQVTSFPEDNMGQRLLFDGMYTGKIFNRSFLLENNIWFNPHRLYADRQFIAKSFACANSISLVHGEVAHWRLATGENKSITQRQLELDNFRDRMMCYFETRDVLRSVLKSGDAEVATQNLDKSSAGRLLWILRKLDQYQDNSAFGAMAHYFLRSISGSWRPDLPKSAKRSAKRQAERLNLVARTPLGRMVWLRVPYLGSWLNKIARRGRPPKNYLPDLMPPDPTIIIFESFFGKEYGGQPRYIYEQLLKTDKYFRAVWVCSPLRDEPLDIPGQAIQVKRGSAEYFDYLARAGFWVNNIRFPVQRKPEGTVYLQTWHGTPLKRLGDDIAVDSGPEKDARQSAFGESRMWDFLLSQNEYSTEKFESAFRPDCPILTMGYPGADALRELSGSNISLRKDLGIPDGKKVILYAPTWRDTNQIEGKSWQFGFEFPFDVKKLIDRLGANYVLVVRMHHLVTFDLGSDLMGTHVFDASKVDDASQVMALADVLVTDYSSIFFDFAATGRPILFFMHDRSEYETQMRGFYLDPEVDLPGPILRSEDELIEALDTVGTWSKENAQKYDRFQKRFLSLQDGNSAQNIIEKVFEGMPDIC